MKRQGNTQQIKEQDKCPPIQTKEEEIGNLPDKEFQIMIVKFQTLLYIFNLCFLVFVINFVPVFSS